MHSTAGWLVATRWLAPDERINRPSGSQKPRFHWRVDSILDRANRAGMLGRKISPNPSFKTFHAIARPYVLDYRSVAHPRH
jgi:hypothetical protein